MANGEQTEKNGIVISSRARLARNLAGYAFPSRLNSEDSLAITQKVYSALGKGAEKYTIMRISDLSELQGEALKEMHLVSDDLLHGNKYAAAIVNPNNEICVMVNEEDHLRIQVLREGFSLKEAAETADRIDTLLSENLDFAFDPELGYLTQCPTNLGTGLRASVMLHLPGLTESGAMPRIASNLSKLGLTIRGTYGEGSKSIGALYQLSNQITLGLSENEAIENLRSITVQLMEEERKARAQMSEEIAWQDKIDRAAGVLKSARVLSSSEFMELLSYIRLGLSTGVLQGVTTQELNALMVNAQPATLMARAGKQLDETQRDVLRADMAREVCAKIKE